MKAHEPTPNGIRGLTPPARQGPGDHPLWLLAFLALLAAQAWMTLGLFGPGHGAAHLLDDQPILSGRHPLHQYHGLLGARAFLSRGTLSCYDPAFQAGYPETPVFDDGSRPAGMLLAAAGGRWMPAAYKLGVAGLCLLAPCVLLGAARGAGLNRLRACLAAGLGMLVWWGKPCRDLLDSGDVGLLLATLALLAQVGLLLRFHRAAGPLGVLGVTLTAFLGWFAHPMLMLLSAPLFLLYYFTAGPRHRLLWHVSLAGALAAAVLANLFWLLDWVNYWHLRTPLNLEAPALTAHTLRAVWQAPAWGEPADRTLACFLAAAAVVGVALMHRRGPRAAGRLFGSAAVGGLLLAGAAVVWGPLARAGADRLFAPALLFAAAPAAHAVARLLRPVRRWGGWATACLAGGAALAVLTLALPSHRDAWFSRWCGRDALTIGLGPERENVVAVLSEKTTNQARILWEDRRGGGPRWTALLPVLTGRAFVGGLDPDAAIEHTAIDLVDQTLAGRPLDDWTDADLADYCDHYNIGWVACWSGKTAERFERFRRTEPGADAEEAPAEMHDGGLGRLITLHRKPTFTLHGSAKIQSADSNRVVLTDVRPSGGQVCLSLHHQAGLRVSPSRIRIEPLTDAHDVTPFVRLKLDEAAPVVTITWDKR
jgi:hypothetical protein